MPRRYPKRRKHRAQPQPEQPKETRAERMERLRLEQRALYKGEPIHRPRVVGKPQKTKWNRGQRRSDAFFRSSQGGIAQ